MNPLGFSILGVAWPLPRLLAAKREGARSPVHVVTVERQLEMNAGPGIPQVRSARQARPPQVGAAKRVVHRQNRTNAGQGVVRLVSAGQGVRLVANAKQGALHNRFRNKEPWIRGHE